jgi:uncharacterized membrane protein
VIDAYPALKLLHILSATLLFGTGLGTAFHMWMAHRSRQVHAIAAAARHTVLADFLFTTPAVIVQPVTGYLLIRLGGIEPASPWLVATYALYALTGACWLPVVRLQIRARDLAAHAAAPGEELPGQYWRIMRWWFALGWPAFTAVIAIFWLMVAQPELW